MWKLKLYRMRKRLLLGLAALPLCQAATGCDPSSIWNAYFNSVVQSSFGILVNASQQVLLQSFPSADLLQTLLGGNRQPFFQF